MASEHVTAPLPEHIVYPLAGEVRGSEGSFRLKGLGLSAFAASMPRIAELLDMDCDRVVDQQDPEHVIYSLCDGLGWIGFVAVHRGEGTINVGWRKGAAL